MRNRNPISRRTFVGAMGGAAVAGCLARRLAAVAAEKPNILLIMGDDVGYECIGANGGTSYRTPNLDRLAREGTRFEHCCATPLCSPSRVELMTGRYGFRNYRGWGILDPRERTFGHLLREAGYATAISGKWQLCRFDDPANADHPRRAGFDESCLWTWDYGKGKPSRYWSPSIWQNGALRTDLAGRYGPDVHRDFVVDFIERNRARPFFAYYTMNLAHAPYVPTPDTPGITDKDKSRENRRYYGDMIAYLDTCIGRVIATLDRLGLREKTLILFTGDNGTPRGITSRLGERPIPGGKGTMTDAGTHVPLIANWRGTVPAGRVSSELVDFSDFFPTFAEAAGARLPEGVAIDGRSFLAHLKGEPAGPRSWVYVHFGPQSDCTATNTAERSVRTRRWKLHGDGRLFDMRADPDEKKPLKAGQGGEEAERARAELAAVLASLAPRRG